MATGTSATLHVLSLAEPVTARGIMRPARPEGVARWLVGTAVTFAGDGTFAPDPTRIQALGIWDDDAARDAFVATVVAAADGHPWSRPVTEAWHAVLEPHRHHGEVSWVDGALLRSEPAARRGGGPIVTMTTTGFHADPDRALALGQAMHDVQSRLDDATGLRRHVVSLGRRDDDGRTFLVWDDEGAATAWAYRADPHAPMPARQRAEDLMPRSSFTRFTVAASHGRWDGTDPVAPCAP